MDNQIDIFIEKLINYRADFVDTYESISLSSESENIVKGVACMLDDLILELIDSR